MRTTLANKLKYLIIHCSATQEGMPITPLMIKAWHTLPPPRGRGWDRVGYSKLFLLDGQIHSFVEENDDDIVDSWELTYGAKGINSISRHICYVGGVDRYLNPKDTRTPAQKESMKNYVFEMIKKYPHIKIAGHNDFAKKACPSFNVQSWLREIGIPEKIFI